MSWFANLHSDCLQLVFYVCKINFHIIIWFAQLVNYSLYQVIVVNKKYRNVPTHPKRTEPERIRQPAEPNRINRIKFIYCRCIHVMIIKLLIFICVLIWIRVTVKLFYIIYIWKVTKLYCSYSEFQNINNVLNYIFSPRSLGLIHDGF